MCSPQSSSISNPFFFDFPSASAAGVIFKSATPIVGTGAPEGAKGTAAIGKEEEKKGTGGGGRGMRRRAVEGGVGATGERETNCEGEQLQKAVQQQCCVVNPFRNGFENQLKQSSLPFFPMSVVRPENSFCCPLGTEPGHAADALSSDAKLLMDSGYRSTTSNSALEEELAMAQRQRRAKRERRRAETKRNHCQMPWPIPPANNADHSSVPNLLRRTCSTAVNGLSGLKMASWTGGRGLTTRNEGDEKAPRRTKSVGNGQIPTENLYGTGWMVEADLSSSDDSPEVAEKGSMGVGDGGGSVEIGAKRVSIQLVQHLLSSCFCFMSGLKTDAGHPVITFPDSRTSLSFEDYQLLVDYLIHLNRVESISPVIEQRCQTRNSLMFSNNLLADVGNGGFVLVVDRRLDKWSSVRNLFSYLMCYFPEPICLVFLLKPEGVLQRAIEYAYRGLLDSSDKFKVVICQNCDELREQIGLNSLTMDVGGTIKHDHLEWSTHRVDIERMKNSARIIAESLSEFGKCLRETELPNDVQSTERILKLQQQERDAIKEDFRISIRKGMALLGQVRHTEQSDRMSPSQLQNVTAIERMISQLQDTERSFDTFWHKHRQRLLGCLELRQFEDEFRKLQNQFAKHMLHLEEHRQVGDSEAVADGLAREHEEYGVGALNDVIRPCRTLRMRGIELSAKDENLSELLNCSKGSDSIGPKCEELNRMAEVLGVALERRGQMLERSRKMHAQIAKANNWCRRGVELLSVAPMDLLSAGCSNNLAIYEHASARLEQFLTEGDTLKVEVVSTASSCFPCSNSSSVSHPMLNPSSAESFSLLSQVTERIDDIRRLSRARHEALKRLGEQKGRQRDGARPVQVVSPEKTPKRHQKMMTHRQFSLDEQLHPPQQLPPPSAAEHVVLHAPYCCSSPSSSKCLCSASTSGLSHSQSAIATSGGFCAMDNNGPRNGLDEEEAIPVKVAYVLEELLSTEKSYVCELDEIAKHYIQSFEMMELSGNSLIPSALRGQSDVLFGNIRELLDFHRSLLLPALLHSSNSVHGVSFVLNTQRHRLLALYRAYCRNKPISEALRKDNSIDQLKFFTECQRRAGHLLPLSAYLLKPIQRITKYQLLLKELIRHCSDADQSQSVQSALTAMLDILAQIDADMEHLHILGYPSDLRLLGALRLRSECEVYTVKRAKGTVSNGSSGGATNRRSGAKGKQQKRHLFLFDGGVLFCKKRPQSVHISGEYFEHKLCIPMRSLAFSECSRHSDQFFDIWDVHDCISYAVKTLEEKGQIKWLQRLARLTLLYQQRMEESVQEGIPMEPYPPWHSKSESSAKSSRPQSWTTTSSSEDGMALSGITSSRSSSASCPSTNFEVTETSVSRVHCSTESTPNASNTHSPRRLDAREEKLARKGGGKEEDGREGGE